MKTFIFLTVFLLLAAVANAQTGKVGIGTNSPQAQLHTTGSVRFDTLKGPDMRQVYADVNGKLSTFYAPNFNGNVFSLTESCTGTSSTISITNMPVAVSSGNIRVKLDITHPEDNLLLIFLISPTGQLLNLAYQNGGGGADFTGTIFWDGAAQSIAQGTSPFKGIYKPMGLTNSQICPATAGTISGFGLLGGGSIVPNGTWTLKVINLSDQGVTIPGKLNYWSISFDNTNPPSFPTLTAGIGTAATGSSSTAIGYFSEAIGNNSTAIGTNVTAANLGSMILGDANDNEWSTSGNNQLTMRFKGGYLLYSSGGVYNGATAVGVRLQPNANSWSTISDRRHKENFEPVNGEAFLYKIAGFKLTSWNYKGQNHALYRHYGPMAQDFYAAFGKDSYGTIGNDTTIATADFEGVNFIAIQALEKRTTTLLRENETLKKENAALQKILITLQAQVRELQQYLPAKMVKK